ncbi:LuxR C-terminal-related transcriptional regulator [Paenarthrobacter ilicis]|uniref:LuxR C-terminal-related transcriptional regulator n=1 Tax=Paenarthrobacter ilicis TaxID=43665 RepID=UPI0028D1DC3C|nr:LuxR C-terminal-related transcriptional regulator [Paenarthrobacter ilicis]
MPGQVLGGEFLTGQSAGVRELLVALSVGFTLPDVLPDRLLARDDINGLVEAAREQGLLTVEGAVGGTVRRALLDGTPKSRLRPLQKELVGKFLDEERLLGDLARELATSGLKDPRVAAELEQWADGVQDTDPELAAGLYAEALLAGASEMGAAARRAKAAVAIGDLDAAGRIIDRLLAAPQPPDVRLGVDVAAAVWAHRGMLARSAETYKWLGPEELGDSLPLAVVALLGSGEVEAAEDLQQGTPPAASPTLLAVALSLTRQGLRQSFGEDPHRALPELIRASDMMNAAGTPVPVPETPAALAALCALHSGEPDMADTVLQAALAAGQGGDAFRPRLFLLQAWSLMQRDRPEDARLAINEAAKANHWPLTPRDGFLLAALEVGLARRGSEVHQLVLAWEKARESMMHVSVDLYSLLPWGEMMIAAARLRDTRRVSHYLDAAWELLDRCGHPTLWAVPLHWAAVQAALLGESPAELAPHAAALVRASGHSHMASVLAAAGKAWVSVLASRFDASDVDTAARGLAAVGMPWEGARLAGHAAAHADDRRDMVRLLACARDLHPQAPHQSVAGQSAPSQPGTVQSATGAALVDSSRAPLAPKPVPDAPDIGGTQDASGLSAREREVGRLLLEGKTYREIGEAIYISPRTAEHHVARMRRRLGAANRSELLVRLRLALGEGYPPP